MKASVKFREDQKPLFRGKIPLNILGFPFQSAIAAGDSKELCLSLCTFFELGPSLKIAYRPNDSWKPFSFVVKTGIGHFGSPIASPMIMSAEFNVISHGCPSFFLHFRPQIGDFSIKKSSDSPITLPSKSTFLAPKVKSHAKEVEMDDEGSIEGIFETPLGNGKFPGRGAKLFPTATAATGAIDSILTGVEISARTSLPIRNRAKINIRWGLRLPAELKDAFAEDRIKNPTTEMRFGRIPFLVLSKIGIEHVTTDDWTESTKRPRNSDLAEACSEVKRHLELEGLQDEQGNEETPGNRIE